MADILDSLNRYSQAARNPYPAAATSFFEAMKQAMLSNQRNKDAASLMGAKATSPVHTIHNPDVVAKAIAKRLGDPNWENYIDIPAGAGRMYGALYNIPMGTTDALTGGFVETGAAPAGARIAEPLPTSAAAAQNLKTALTTTTQINAENVKKYEALHSKMQDIGNVLDTVDSTFNKLGNVNDIVSKASGTVADLATRAGMSKEGAAFNIMANSLAKAAAEMDGVVDKQTIESIKPKLTDTMSTIYSKYMTLRNLHASKMQYYQGQYDMSRDLLNNALPGNADIPMELEK